MNAILDPRENIQHELTIGQVYEDDRSGNDVLLVYLDSHIAILRDRDDNHRLQSRRVFEQNVGSGRFKLSDGTDAFGATGRMARVLSRANEYENMDGRKNTHYAKAMREAIEILTDQGAEDAHEPVEFEKVSGIGSATADALRGTGVRTRGDVRQASDSELLDVSGIGSQNLKALREHVA